jgi:hypothetical protein
MGVQAGADLSMLRADAVFIDLHLIVGLGCAVTDAKSAL